MKHKIQIKKEYETYDLVNIISTATYACSYWCEAIDYNADEYKEAKTRLMAGRIESVCHEEILVEMLETGKSIYFIDGKDESINELTLKKLLRGIKKNAEARPWDCDLNNWDMDTMDCIIQYALFNKTVYV